jgi:hypothetical protein
LHPEVKNYKGQKTKEFCLLSFSQGFLILLYARTCLLLKLNYSFFKKNIVTTFNGNKIKEDNANVNNSLAIFYNQNTLQISKLYLNYFGYAQLAGNSSNSYKPLIYYYESILNKTRKSYLRLTKVTLRKVQK